MAMWTGVPSEAAVDGCAELRLEVASRCEEAHAAIEAHTAASEETRARKRELVSCQHQVETALSAADPSLRRADKATAYEVYLTAYRAAADDAERTQATATWAATIDRINRQGRLAARTVTRTRSEAAAAEEALRAAQRSEQALRFKAEAAQAACLDGRVRLAACDEGVTEPEVPLDPTVEPGPRADQHAYRLAPSPGQQPFVVEAVLAGDDEALEAAARAVAERAVLSPAEARLQLRELVDAITAAAGQDGYLVFDPAYPLWSQLTPEESHDVVRALARLGYGLEPLEGWHNGRSPSSADLSMALGYAGLDTRQMRNLPGAAVLAAMPASISVDPQAFLAVHAPDLAVDDLVRLLGPRAAHLESLWDAWGQVRPVLFTTRDQLLALEHTGVD
jgi:hypothetical protein